MRPRFAGGTVDLRPEEIVRLDGDRVVLLDQRRLPDEEVELECRSAGGGRGDPDAGGPRRAGDRRRGRVRVRARGRIGARISTRRRASLLAVARPTAVNLAWAIDRRCGAPRRATSPSARAQIHRDEVDRCRRDGRACGRALRGGLTRRSPTATRAALATGGLRHGARRDRAALRARARRARCCVDETRPLLQGGRLTAWELERAGIPYAVIADARGRLADGRAARSTQVRRRRRPDRRQRRHGEQDRHVRARRPRARPRHPVLRRRADVDRRPRDPDRRRDPHRGARPVRGQRRASPPATRPSTSRRRR